ncbi:MAG TPA: LamG domain-containing protein [Steroidobacteraceae bacterium]
MTILNRRSLLLSLGAAVAPVALASTRKHVWKFDNIRKVDGHAVRVEGMPKVIDSPVGRAVLFDGQKDALFIGNHPLAGAKTFTAELVFRPDGGAFEQRLLHLESDETPAVEPGKSSTRMLFEIRVVKDSWYLDAFMVGAGYRQAMMATDKLHPLGRWYHVAKTYDGQFFRSYVNGVLQMEVAMPFTPQGPGRATVGARMNQVTHFQGAIRQARFTHEALPVKTFSRRIP